MREKGFCNRKMQEKAEVGDGAEVTVLAVTGKTLQVSKVLQRRKFPIAAFEDRGGSA